MDVLQVLQSIDGSLREIAESMSVIASNVTSKQSKEPESEATGKKKQG